MTIPSDSNVTGHLARLRAATEKWWSQVIFYLALLSVFFLIDQLVVVNLYSHHFYFPGSILNLLFLDGGWIPGFANAIVIGVASRTRTFFVYLMSVAILTYILSIAYYYMTGLVITDSHDPTGGVGIVFVWMIDWFWGGVIGFVINLLIGGK